MNWQENKRIFSKRASELILQSGLTQNELMQALDLSNGSVANLKNKNAQNPSADTIFKMANYFGVSADYLLGLTDTKTTDKATKELCDTLGISEEVIEVLKEKTNINETLNFLFYQDKITKRFQDINKSCIGRETVFEIDAWSRFSILELLSEFIELANTSYKDDIFYSITPDGVLQLGKMQFDGEGEMESVKMEKRMETGLKNRGFDASSMVAYRMQRIINLLTAQLQTFVEDKFICAFDASKEE